MEPCKQFGERLKEYRKAAGLTQWEVHAATGISPATLSRWECGGSKPSAEQLEMLLALYNEKLSKLYPDYVPVMLLPPLKTDGGYEAEAIGTFREELIAFDGHLHELMDAADRLLKTKQ